MLLNDEKKIFLIYLSDGIYDKNKVTQLVEVLKTRTTNFELKCIQHEKSCNQRILEIENQSDYYEYFIFETNDPPPYHIQNSEGVYKYSVFEPFIKKIKPDLDIGEIFNANNVEKIVNKSVNAIYENGKIQ